MLWRRLSQMVVKKHRWMGNYHCFLIAGHILVFSLHELSSPKISESVAQSEAPVLRNNMQTNRWGRITIMAFQIGQLYYSVDSPQSSSVHMCLLSSEAIASAEIYQYGHREESFDANIVWGVLKIFGSQWSLLFSEKRESIATKEIGSFMNTLDTERISEDIRPFVGSRTSTSDKTKQYSQSGRGDCNAVYTVKRERKERQAHRHFVGTQRKRALMMARGTNRL